VHPFDIAGAEVVSGMTVQGRVDGAEASDDRSVT
jgi:hypothetical protein